MVIVYIILCVLAVGVTLFKILGVIDFINMPGRKKNKSKAENNTTSPKENDLMKKE
jgi:hypothetical protein